MKKNLFKEIKIPEGIEVKINDSELSVKGSEGENKKIFNLTNLTFEIDGDQIRFGNEKSTKNEKKKMNTIASHIKNMIQGVQKKFEYKMKICFNHFPFTINMNGKNVLIKNFLGEKIDRSCKICKNADVKIDKEIVTIVSCDKEAAGQTAANFETVTKVKNRDRRVFQDGIFITHKEGIAI